MIRGTRMTKDDSRYCTSAIVIAVLALVAGIVVAVDAIAASSARHCPPAISLPLDAAGACPAERAAPAPAPVLPHRHG